jgi:hypothetical protein
MDLSGNSFPALADDLDRAIDELIALFDRDPAAWARTRPGKWSGGQHAEHLALANDLGTTAFENRRRALDAGALPPPPARWPLQRLFFAGVVHRGAIPRGAKAIPPARPTLTPERDDVVRRLRDSARRFRAVATGLDAAALDRLWIKNPFAPAALKWHYTLPEFARMQAVHIRHHVKQIEELNAVTR